MKFKIYTVIALAGLLFAACSSENNGNGSTTDPGNTKSAYLRILKNNSSTRAVEGSADGTTAELYNALIYFLDGAEDPQIYSVMTAAETGADLTLDELEEGVLVEDVSSQVTRVYVVGNYDSADEFGRFATLPTTTGQRLSAVQNVLLNIQQVSYGQLGTLADGTSVDGLITVMDGQAILQEYTLTDSNWTGTTTPNVGDLYANVSISPIVSRLEVLELNYTGDYDYTLEGMYVNNYYQNLPLSLSLQGHSYTNNGSNVNYYDVGNAMFAYTNYSTLYDEIDEDVTGATVINPGTGLVWAYQVFGGSNPTPHIILKLVDVTTAEGDDLGDLYLTVKGFRNGNDEIMTFQRNRIYRINSLTFDDGDLTIVPEPETVNVWVHVEVEPWITIDVEPII